MKVLFKATTLFLILFEHKNSISWNWIFKFVMNHSELRLVSSLIIGRPLFLRKETRIKCLIKPITKLFWRFISSFPVIAMKEPVVYLFELIAERWCSQSLRSYRSLIHQYVKLDSNKTIIEIQYLHIFEKKCINAHGWHVSVDRNAKLNAILIFHSDLIIINKKNFVILSIQPYNSCLKFLLRTIDNVVFIIFVVILWIFSISFSFDKGIALRRRVK